ncbi:MAG: hypothetical protein NTW21_32260 [Verrucomicrobia bacterium]|nr:hypothetical protein [Verrucomicrobiota bacterium]
MKATPTPSKKPRQWTRGELNLLGKMEDRELAKKLGVSRSTVRVKRRGLGIATRYSRMPKLPASAWSKRDLALLGTMPDANLAARLKLKHHSVFKMRQSLKIASYARQKLWHKWTAKDIALLGTKPDSVFAKRFGTTIGAVSAKRRFHGITSHWAQHKSLRPRKTADAWTKAELALLGTMSDQKVANRLKLGHGSVYSKRIELGIPPHFGSGRARGARK